MKVFGKRTFPSIPHQIGNAVSATARAVGALVAHRPVRVPNDVLASREAICRACEENLSGRCRKCGCGVRSQFIRKTHLATERCPLEPPKWDTYSP